MLTFTNASHIVDQRGPLFRVAEGTLVHALPRLEHDQAGALQTPRWSTLVLGTDVAAHRSRRPSALVASDTALQATAVVDIWKHKKGLEKFNKLIVYLGEERGIRESNSQDEIRDADFFFDRFSHDWFNQSNK